MLKILLSYNFTNSVKFFYIAEWQLGLLEKNNGGNMSSMYHNVTVTRKNTYVYKPTLS